MKINIKTMKLNEEKELKNEEVENIEIDEIKKELNHLNARYEELLNLPNDEFLDNKIGEELMVIRERITYLVKILLKES